MSNRLAWKVILVFAGALAGVAAIALCISVLMDRHETVAAVPVTPPVLKVVSNLQSRMEAGELRFSRDSRILQDTKLFPLQSISLQRTLCFGDCPIYIMTLRRDGHASLITDDLGDNQVKYYEAVIQPELFARATQLAQSAMESASKQEYAGQWTDDYSAIMRVESDAGSWCVSDYGQVAPVQVWAMEQLMQQFRTQIDWTAFAVSSKARPYPDTLDCETSR